MRFTARCLRTRLDPWSVLLIRPADGVPWPLLPGARIEIEFIGTAEVVSATPDEALIALGKDCWRISPLTPRRDVGVDQLHGGCRPDRVGDP